MADNNPGSDLRTIGSSVNSSTGYDLETLALSAPAFPGLLDLKPYMVELSYFEDMYNNTISGKLVLSDSVGVLNFTTLNGTEFLKIKLNKARDYQASIERTFRIYSVSDRNFDKSMNHESYTIHFCSEEFLISEQYRLCKAYKKKSISEIVFDVLTNVMKIDKKNKKNIYIDETSGVYDFVLPNKKIFETINWLCTYALSKSKEGADYLFFENAQGYYFKSLQNLFQQDSAYLFNYDPKNTDQQDVEKKLFTVLKMEVLDYFDTLKSTSNGTFANRLISIDPLSRKKYVTDFNYNQYFQKSDRLNSSPVTNNYKNRFGKQLFDAPPKDLENGTLRLCVSNSVEGNVNYVRNTPGSVSNDFFVEKYLPNRVAQIALANHTRLKITVPGNTDLVTGMIVSLGVSGVSPMSETLNNSIADSPKERNYDPYLSGRYIISAMRHVISPTTFVTILEISKESGLINYSGINPDDSGWNSVVKGSQK